MRHLPTMFIRLIAISVLLPCLAPAQAQVEPDKWEIAATTIRRLAPVEFSTLPVHVIDFMKERGCLVPQSGFADDERPPENVVQGEFSIAGQTDWAMFCSKEMVSSIHILWGGPHSCPEPMSALSDRNFLQGSGSLVIFSRVLFRTSPDSIRATYEYLTTQPDYADSKIVFPEVDHDALDDAFVPKGSSRWYCRNGSWEQVVGGD